MKLEIDSRKNTGKFTNMCKLNNTLLNNQWAREEIRKYLEKNKNENITYQNSWDAAKAVI